ncbi:MAG: IS4 family transposase, partial [Nanoarchaeota archaeon]|nr:IS4 family transposase [Nanoarchaeota archaeon]
LIEKTRKLYLNSNDFSIDLEGTPYALDSTVIKLSLGLFKWAKFKKETSAIKVHTQLDLRGNIPSFFLITEAKVHDVNLLDILEFEEGAYYIMDRGYIDFERLYRIHQKKAFFIIRSKSSTSFVRLYSQKINKTIGIRCDQIIKFKQFYAAKDYPEKLRRIKYYDEETDHYYTYLTNNFDLDAKVVADLYKHRWQIELFFKWIKQHLHIGTFWGHSANAVKIQICIAISTFLVIAIIKKELKIERDLYEILQILSISQLEKTAINTLVSESDDFLNDHTQKQACLFDF